MEGENEMIRGRDILEDNGFTLTETMIAVCVITILVGLAGLQYSVWVQRYNVEREVREMYTDFMKARARAMQRNRLHYIDFVDSQYTIYEDSYDAALGESTPDGDGKLQKTAPGDAAILQKRTHYVVESNFGAGATRFYFNSRGLSSANGSVRLTSDVVADYDCVIVFATRIHLGKWNGEKCRATL